jgi:signal transduction histidine kinase
MRERVQLLDGQLVVESSSGSHAQGTTLVAEIPLT